MEEPTHPRPRGAELLYCFNVGPPPTTLAQHETSWSTSCLYSAANTNRHPDVGPAANLQRKFQRHLIKTGDLFRNGDYRAERWSV